MFRYSISIYKIKFIGNKKKLKYCIKLKLKILKIQLLLLLKEYSDNMITNWCKKQIIIKKSKFEQSSDIIKNF